MSSLGSFIFEIRRFGIIIWGKSIKKITIRGVGECTCLTSWEASVVCRRLCRG